MVNPHPLATVLKRRATDTAYCSPAPGSPGGPLKRRASSPSPHQPHYLQISHGGDSGEDTGWRAQIWHSSQAGASKSPRSPKTPPFIDPELPAGGKGEAAQEGGVGRVPHCSLRSAPCRAGEAGFWSRLLGAPGTDAQGARRRLHAKATCRSVGAGVSPPDPRQSP